MVAIPEEAASKPALHEVEEAAMSYVKEPVGVQVAVVLLPFFYLLVMV